MKKHIKKVLQIVDDILLRRVVKFLWPQYKRQRRGHLSHWYVIKKYFITQKVFRINGGVPWPVDFRSSVSGWKNIEKGIMCDPGDNPGLYINAWGGLKIGSNCAFAANTTITSTNHDIYDHSRQSKVKGIEIGDNVWVGTNCAIVAGAKIGSNVTIGPNCTIRGEIPDNTIVVAGRDTLKFIKKKPYKWDWSKEELL